MQVWQAVKETRKSLLSTTIKPTCTEDDTLLADDYIVENGKNLLEKLKLDKNATVHLSKKPTLKSLEAGVQMFTYLNYCPLPTSLAFYDDLFRSASSKNILLALTNIVKTSYNADKIISNKIFIKVMELLQLSLYKDIDYVTKMENTMNKNNVSSFENLKLLGLIFFCCYGNLRIFNITILGSKKILKLTNHPVHIIDDDGQFSPTALIPFCEFSGNMSAMGVKIDLMETPVCNSFKAKIVRDQLCYTVDPNKFMKSSELSLALFISYNEDRHWSGSRKVDDAIENNDNFIILETIGMVCIMPFHEIF